MEKEENYSASLSGNFTALDYTHHHHHLMKPQIGETSADNNGNQMVVDYNNMVHGSHEPQQEAASGAMMMSSGGGFCGSTASLDKLSFADVMQFADFGPKLGLINSKTSSEEETGIDDPVYFLKFPVLNHDDDHHHLRERESELESYKGKGELDDDDDEVIIRGGASAVQLRILGENLEKNIGNAPAAAEANNKNKRKRPRTVKTTEEVESQRMTHIAVERNRRKQMNEHLRVLRSLMPGSYVQRGDQASIIGGAIEFVRELEQLLQCLESQKRRRLYGGDGGGVGGSRAAPMAADDSSSSSLPIQQQQQPPFLPPLGQLPNDQMKLVELETAGQLREETAESKSCLADIEVKLLGFDAMIKILSRRRPGQLIKTIAALEDLQLNILHTNITTIEQTVLYSFNVKVAGETRVTAEDIANSVQQIFSFIHADSSIMI